MMRMQRERAQLLIIDVQEKLLPAVCEPERVTNICLRLMKAAKYLGVPITVSEQYPQGIGPTVAPLLAEVNDSIPVLSKFHFSCLRDDALHNRIQKLRGNGHNQIVLAGIESHVCVMQTAMDLIADGLQVYIVADAVSSRADTARELALQRLRALGAAIVDSEMVIFEWLDRAGTPEFKGLLPLIK